MRRREFIAGLGSAAAWPLAARAQQPAMPVIGYFGDFSLSLRTLRDSRAAFHKGLGETGYIEGQNVSIEYRWMEGRADRLPALARDLVGRRVSVIVATNNPDRHSRKGRYHDHPDRFQGWDDPVAAGIVASLNRPGANATGIYNFNQDLGPKRLELLREFLPTARQRRCLVQPQQCPFGCRSETSPSLRPNLGAPPNNGQCEQSERV